MATVLLKPPYISGLGLNANAVYDPAQLQAIADKLDELIDGLNRA